MKTIEKNNILLVLLATLLLNIAYSVEGKSAMDKKNAGPISDLDTNLPPSNDEDNYDYDESSSPEKDQPLPTSHAYFDKKNTTIYVKEMGRKLILECPVKNVNDKEEIIWFKEKNNIAVGKSSLSDVYEVDDMKFRLIIKNYNDTAIERNFYCEILPQHKRFHILVKVGEGAGSNGANVSPPPEQILASSMPEFAAGSATIRIIESIHLLCVLMTTLGGMKFLQAV